MNNTFKDKLKNIFNKNKSVEVKQNPFTQIELIDKRIEKINQCRKCGSLFGKDFSNIDIENNKLDGRDITKVICKNCGYIHYFTNWHNK